MFRTFVTLLLLGITGVAPAATVSGRVVDEVTQQPIAGATVTQYSVFAGFLAIGPTTETDADGRYAFTFALSGDQTQSVALAAGATQHALRNDAGLACESPGFCEPGAAGFTLTADTQRIANFVLPRAARLRGQVTDLATGAPVAGTTLFMSGTGPGGLIVSRFVQSGPDGEFVFGQLHAGGYRLKAEPAYWEGGPLPHLTLLWPDLHCDHVHQLCEMPNAATIALAVGADSGMLPIRLKRGSVLRARMLSQGNGSAVQQNTVVGTAAADRRISGGVRDDGYAYVGPLLPGAVALALAPYAEDAYPATIHPDMVCATRPCDLAGAPTIDIPEATLVTAADVLVSPLRTIRGRVTDVAGMAVAGIPVHAGTMEWLFPLPPVGFRSEASSLTGVDGTYRLEGMHNTAVIVRTKATAYNWIDSAWPDTPCDGDNLFCQRPDADYSRVDLEVEAHPAGIDLRIRAGQSLEGRVIDAISGLPVSGAQVALVPTGSLRRSQPVSTDSEGRFRFNGLADETFYLFASFPSAPRRYVSAVYPDVPCETDSAAGPLTCELGSAVVVTPLVGNDFVIRLPRTDTVFVDNFET